MNVAYPFLKAASSVAELADLLKPHGVRRRDPVTLVSPDGVEESVEVLERTRPDGVRVVAALREPEGDYSMEFSVMRGVIVRLGLEPRDLGFDLD